MESSDGIHLRESTSLAPKVPTMTLSFAPERIEQWPLDAVFDINDYVAQFI